MNHFQRYLKTGIIMKRSMLVEKDSENDIYECADEDLQMMIPVMSKGNLLCYLIDTSKFEHLDEMKISSLNLQRR